MPQKSRSKKQTRNTPASRQVESQTTATASAPQSSQVTSSASSARSFTTEFNPDYSQTIKDLKRIGLLAGIFFSVLIALGFILP